jgi:hypothetical protein
MKLLKAIKSTFEAIGMTVFIFLVYSYFERGFVLEDLLISAAVSVFLVWITNKAFRWSADHFEVEECPYCGAELDFEEVDNTNHGFIQRMDVDTMGKFLLDWGLACIRNEEPKDVFAWLESKGGEIE